MRQLFCILVIVFCLYGCAAVPSTPPKPKDPHAAAQAFIEKNADRLARRQETLRRTLSKRPPLKMPVRPVMPVYDPLDDHIVSFSMVDESIQSVLYALAKAVGMNIILDPSIKDEKRRLTLNFEKVPASQVLREVLASYDLFYENKDNVLRIKPYQEAMFSLNFLNTEVNSDFAVGGDVLGAGEDKAIGGLAGNFKLTGRSAGQGNAYDVLENNIKGLLSSGGKYALNRLSGSLYLKDTPAVIHSVARLVNNLKEMLGRQILIEARIIEVALSDEHRYGIDWSVLREEVAGLARSTLTGWNLGQGLILRHQDGDHTIDAVIDALDEFGHTRVVSNPSIRSKHSKPAIISVGTSFSYKKSIETTRTSNGTSEDLSTQVDVSTVFDGLILGVIPFIEEDGHISLLINPIKSDVDRASLEPESVGGADSGLSISLPRVLVKEISTTISLANNEVAVLGGLIDRRKESTDSGVPGLSKIPVLGYLFKNKVETEETRELVIILSVSLV
jgi:MSHA type pilus biogenesis protein MshL